MTHLGHDGAIIARGPCDGSTAANLIPRRYLQSQKIFCFRIYLMLKIANNSSLRHLSDRENVADGQLSLLAAIHELTSVHALSSNEELLLQAMLVHTAELNHSKGSTTAGIVDDLLDHTLDIAVALSKVQRAQLGRTLSVLGVGLENGTTTPTASTNDTALEKRCRLFPE